MDESDGFVEVRVWRTGTDLSRGGTVTVRSRRAEPVSAEGEVLRHRPARGRVAAQPSDSDSAPAGVDYVGISRNLDFAPGVSLQTVDVAILDDLGRPELEGVEAFELVLRMPVNGVLGEPAKATVFINDSASDRECCPPTHRGVSSGANGPPAVV